MIVTVTSLNAGEGKSTIIKNKAEEHKIENVVVVDLDVYRPVLAERYCVKAENGIIEYLEGGDLNMIDIDGIKLIPCLKSGKTLKEVIENNRFAELLESLSNNYGAVYIDAPPISVTTDVKDLFDMCDGVVLVKGQRWNIYTEMHMKKFFDRVNIIETVNNEMPRRNRH